MLSKTKHLLFNSVGGGAVIIAIFSILSRLVGLLRDRLLTSKFGAGEILDAYYAAFRLPDLVFNTLVLGALSSAFIPIFLEVWSKNKDEAWRVANSVLNILFTVIFFFAVVFSIFAPLFINLIVPGFRAEMKNLTIQLTRIILIGILFFTLSNVASGILNSFRRFFAYSLAPVMYNLGIIAGILFLVPWWGPIGLAWGVVFGSLLHYLVQLPSLYQTGYRWQGVFNYFHPAVKKIGLLMLPRCFGLA
ncbi:MAG: lipid II flippase MurJ, partial [Patescibacteria group bacterium]